MLKTIKKGIELNKAEKLMHKINKIILDKISFHWKCFIKIDNIGSKSLVIRYKGYDDWKEEDLVYVLKLIQAITNKHSISMYRYECEHRLEIEVDINE
jgi:predicted transcriptional regulator